VRAEVHVSVRQCSARARRVCAKRGDKSGMWHCAGRCGGAGKAGRCMYGTQCVRQWVGGELCSFRWGKVAEWLLPGRVQVWQ